MYLDISPTSPGILHPATKQFRPNPPQLQQSPPDIFLPKPVTASAAIAGPLAFHHAAAQIDPLVLISELARNTPSAPPGPPALSPSPSQTCPSPRLAPVSRIAYSSTVKASELPNWLEHQGCRIEQATNHWIVRLGGNRTTIPPHPSQEIKTATDHAILRQLGLKRKCGPDGLPGNI